MGKREASMFAAQLEGVDLDAPRAKRHKTAASSPVAIKEEPATTNGAADADTRAADVQEDPEAVREKGLKLWQTIKDAVNKEGRALSTDFLRLPSKRLYPDYYDLIKKPIALDDIKRQLEHGGYANFDEVKQDFEQCFKNAKRYNMKESQIWKDAKHLHKLVIKESNKLTGGNETADDDHDANGAEGGSDAEGEGGKKKKPPNMTRLLKSRLQKLVDKTDDDGRVLSAEFLDLPSKKMWPTYYKQIKRPQCLENIFKHLKRKEYTTALDFANDVELVFSNALEFNQEHTPIWEDAIVLRDYFRQLMSDLPPPYSIPAYASPDHSTKIKLKMPTATHPASVISSATGASAGVTQHGVAAAVASPRLRIPPLAITSGTPTPAQSQPHASAVPLSVTPISMPPGAAASTPTVSPSTVPTPTLQAVASPYAVPVATQAVAFNQQAYAYAQQKQQHVQATYQTAAVASASTPSLPNTNNIHVNAGRVAAKAQRAAHSPVVQTTAPQTSKLPPPTKVPNQIPPSLIAAKSPTPTAMQNRRQLRYVSVVTKPFGRRLDLDYRDGVRTWSARLGPHETSISISDVKFLSPHRGEDDESSDDEENKNKDKDKDKDQAHIPETAERQEEEEEEPEEVQEPPQEEPKPKRGRGRPRKKPRGGKPVVEMSPKGKGKAKAPEVPVEEEVQVKWNDAVVKPLQEGKEAWEMDLMPGLNVVEVGERGGIVWRMYLDRTAAA